MGVNQVYNVIIVGGGASGLLAAQAAASAGVSVLLLERMPRLGCKLRITGKGRCNITNLRPINEYSEVMHGAVELLEEAFNQFDNHAIVALLEEEGVPTVLERGIRVYTASGRAQDVVDALEHRCRRLGVEIRCGVMVNSISRTKEGLWSAQTTTNGEQATLYGDTLILACGGKGYPRTGSDGSGYTLAQSVGHTLEDIFPALVGFSTVPRLLENGRYVLRNVGVEVRVEQGAIARDFGEVELTDEGVGGSAILRVSRITMEALRRGESPQITLDLKPALSHAQLEARLRRDIAKRGNERLHSLARAWVPYQLVKTLLRFSGISSKALGAELTGKDVANLVNTLKCIRLRVRDHEGWNRVVVTAGGVRGQEMNPKTLQSRVAPGLYICGELLDLDANTGGYNLQIAYSTGVLAGRSAAQKVRAKQSAILPEG